VVSWFFIPFLWIIVCILLFVITIIYFIQLIKKIKTKKNIEILIKFSMLVSLFFLTTFKFNYLPQILLEKIDWVILFDKRNEVVKKVKNGDLRPNVSWNGVICELPFEFPIVSNGGNNIVIELNEDEKYTIVFYVFANFFENPSTKFVYTESDKNIQYFERKIKEHPSNNWKLRENWYRIYGE
jgi:energy-coupling factor transporter transmembrane protein EcfT